ncbi:MAG: hypothetical protein WB810_17230 [Candidatus Cybelea sp.]
MLDLRRFTRPALVLAVVLVTGCGGNATTPNVSGIPSGTPQGSHKARASLTTPALITFDPQTGGLAYFKIQHNGSQSLNPFTSSLGVSAAYALAGDGDVVIIASYSPAAIVTYNVNTKAQTTMSDPYGNPFDVAVDKHGNIYAMNIANVAVFKAGSSTPTELTCSYVNTSEAIAVNDEGDVFVDGYGSTFEGVIEYPAGSQNCMKPHLRATRGYIAGVGVDPKTDELIVVDDPDDCAGGIEGRMVIYPKPYEQRTSIRRVLNASYCSGAFRLDANSTHIFYSDATVSDGRPIIDEARYPTAKFEGQYWLGYFSSQNFSGITTIPNRLPN